jgi:outer membrane protein
MRRACMACMTLFVLATSASAQQPGVLTRDDAVRTAREHNPAFLRVLNDLDVAGASVRSARASAFLPSLSTSVRLSGGESTAITGEDPFGQTIRLPEALTSQSSSANQDVSAQMTLFDGFSSFRTLDAQRAAYAATEASIEAQAIQLAGQVSRDYYNAVRTARLIALEEALLASAQERLVRTEELLRLAARNRVDVLGARGDVAQSEQSVARARGEADKARLALAATMGLDPATPFTLDTLLPPVFDPAVLDHDALVAAALHAHPVVRQRSAAVGAAEQRAAAARGRRWPTITANAGYNRNMNRTGYAAFGEVNPPNYRYSFGLSATLPIFTRYQTSATIAEANAAASDAEHDLRGSRIAVERDVRSALIDLDNAYASLQLAELNVVLGRERQELTQEQYRLGGITFTDLQNVIDRTAAAERQALDARFQFITALIALEERAGRGMDELVVAPQQR